MTALVPRRTIVRTIVACGLGAMGSALAGSARGGTLSSPAEKAILTVTGLITNTNEGDAASFDRPMLEALGLDGFRTMTPWYDRPVRFEGVRMRRLMQAVGAFGTDVVAFALNDYVIEIPMCDFDRHGALLAMKRDGVDMPVRDKGPLFIVYPYDSKPELRSQQFYSRSAWQVARLVVT